MSIETFKGIKPKISKSAFVHESAVIIGDVTIGDNSSIWPNCVIRGDVQKVIIGNRTNVQDGSILHVTSDTKYCEGGIPLNIGNNVTIGHNSNLHACEIRDNVLIGIGSIILDGVIMHEYSMLGAGSLISPKRIIASKKLFQGSPAKESRDLTCEEIEYINFSASHYAKLTKDYG